MMERGLSRWWWVSAACLAACGGVAKPVGTASAGSCAGAVDAAPSGTRPADDAELLAKALGQPEQGKLCSGQVLEAATPLVLYRVWQRDKPYTERGRWWSIDRPTGTRERYRADNAICSEWSSLDVVSRCTLRAGARLVLGPGQSARCEGGAVLEASAVNQVYVDQDTRAGRDYFDDCETLGDFP
jgi:hypothetical protein